MSREIVERINRSGDKVDDVYEDGKKVGEIRHENTIFTKTPVEGYYPNGSSSETIS